MTTTTMGWQVDLAGARGYEANLVPAAMDPWAAHLVDAVGLASGDRVLDLACGTGIVTRHAAPRVGSGGRLVGVDANPAMLAVAREVTGALVPRPTWHEATADDLPLPEGEVDAVLCQQAMQFMDDPVATLVEARRVLSPAGRLGIGTCASLHRQPGYTVLVDVVARHLDTGAAEVLGSPYGLGEVDRLRDVVAGAGFTGIHVGRTITPFRFPSPRAFLAAESSSSPLGDLTDTLPAATLDPLLDDLTAGLRPHGDDDGLVFPFETLVVTAVHG